MLYVKLNGQGAVERYPYTLTNLKRDNKNVSWPKTISNETAAEFNVFPVTPADQPAYDHTKDLQRTAIEVDGSWVEQWTEVDASAEEIAARTESQANGVRNDRNERLAECDWTQLADSPLDADAKTAWALYRETLRMVPDQPGFPWNVEWPPVPGN
jgi:hypothetical protein